MRGWLAVSLVWVCLAGTAHAQERPDALAAPPPSPPSAAAPSPPSPPREPLVEVSAELTVSHGQQGSPDAMGPTTIVATIVEGRVRPARWLELHVAVPVAYLANERGPRVRAHDELDLGSTYFGAALVHHTEGVRFRWELGVALAFGSRTFGSLFDLGRDLANWFGLTNAYGGRDIWLWNRNRTGVVASLLTQWRRVNFLLLEAGGALFVLTDGHSSDLLGQVEGAAGWATESVDLGARARLVLMAGPNVLGAVEPFVTTRVGPLAVTLCLTIAFGALNSPYALDWGLHLRATLGSW